MTQFTPVLMYRDNEKINNALENDEAVKIDLLEKLTASVRAAESLIDRKLSKDEIQGILNNGFAPILAILKDTFQFPKATDAFNLESMGLDISESKKLANQLSAEYGTSGTAFIEGEFVFQADRKDQITEQFSVYSTTEKQNEAFEYTSKLVSILNEGLETGFIDQYGPAMIERGIKYARVPLGKSLFEINHRDILEIRG